MRPFWWKSGNGFFAYSRKRLLLLSGDIAMGIWARKYRYCNTGLCKDEQSFQVRGSSCCALHLSRVTPQISPVPQPGNLVQRAHMCTKRLAS